MREITQLRSVINDDKKMIVEGKAITYEEETRLFKMFGTDFYEVIERGAFAGAELMEAFFKYNHSSEQLVLARYKNGTLAFEDREDGVYIKAELADTTLGRDLYTLIQRGDIDKMSFAFTVKEESQEKKNEGKKIIFRVKKIGKIYDVAAVPHPAYDGTDIYARRRVQVETDSARVETRNRNNIKKLQIKIRSILKK